MTNRLLDHSSFSRERKKVKNSDFLLALVQGGGKKKNFARPVLLGRSREEKEKPETLTFTLLALVVRGREEKKKKLVTGPTTFCFSDEEKKTGSPSFSLRH